MTDETFITEAEMKGWTPTGVLQDHFFLSSLQNILFHRVLAHKAVDTNVRLLSYPVGTCHGLQIVLRVPITLKEVRTRGWKGLADLHQI